MKRYGIIFLLLLAGLLAGGDILTVLAVSDTHAADNWRSLAPLIRQERERAGSDVLLADAGDTLHGNFPGSIRNGELPLRILNFLRFDIWVPGNHDFELPPYRFGEFRGTVLGGGWRTRDFAPGIWKMFRRAGRNIAVIGMGESGMPRRVLPRDGITFLDREKVLTDAVREALEAKADFIILIRHDGMYSAAGSLYHLLQRHPEIGLVICAHTHEEIPGKRVGNAWVVQPGSHARALAVIRIAFRRKPEMPVITSVLHYAETGMPMDWPPEIAALWRESFRRGRESVRSLPGGLRAPADRDFSGAFGDSAETALRRATGAQVTIFMANQNTFAAPDPVTERALFRLLPYECRICTVRLTREELAEVIRDYVRFQRKRRNLAIRFGGMKVYRDKRGLLRKVNLPPPGPDGRILVAMTNFELAGGGSRTSPLPGWIAKGMPYTDTGILLRKYISALTNPSKSVY